MSDIMIPQPGAVFGDLTIVHNINFNGQSNPMQMMAMQQQNMMLAATAANMQRIAIQQMNAAVTHLVVCRSGRALDLRWTAMRIRF